MEIIKVKNAIKMLTALNADDMQVIVPSDVGYPYPVIGFNYSSLDDENFFTMEVTYWTTDLYHSDEISTNYTVRNLINELKNVDGNAYFGFFTDPEGNDIREVSGINLSRNTDNGTTYAFIH